MPKKSILKLDRKPNLYLKDTAAKGYGVFCTTDIKAGEELERTPAIILNDKDNDLVSETFLYNYVFKLGAVSKKLRQDVNVKKLDDASCVVMGIASYCNHDEKPNAEVVWDEVDDMLYYLLMAIKDIPKNTEICTSYGKDWFKNR